MDAIKAEIERKRKAKQEEFQGKKYAKRSDIEALRLAKLREEEAAEAARKNKNAQPQAAATTEGGNAPAAPATEEPASSAAEAADAAAQAKDTFVLPKELEELPREEVIARLRKLKHPVTLFGETDRERVIRLHFIQREISTEEDKNTGQQANEMQKKLKEIEEARALYRLGRGGEKGAGPSAPAAESTEKKEEEDPTAAAFKRAAEEVAKKLAMEKMDYPDRVALYFKGLMAEWEAEVEERIKADEHYLSTQEGRETLSTVKLTQDHIKPLFRLLKHRQLPLEIERALWLMTKAMQARNYREAGDIYVRVAIGNAPWPIGVTMVGIHERSSREKISSSTQAHVMHDEQTRKYLQSIKRLLTFAQRKHPALPSMCWEFNSGVQGSDKQALLEAEKVGDDMRLLSAQAIPETYAFKPSGERVDGWRANDNDIRTWSSILKQAEREMQPGTGGGAAK